MILATGDILTFTFIAALLVVSPGPNGLLIARTVPTAGMRAGFANVAGFVVSFYLHGALAILGISILLVRSSEAFLVFKTAGAIYLCWIGIRSLCEAWRGNAAAAGVSLPARPRKFAASFAEGFLTNALNPKVAMFYLAAFPQFMPVGEGAAASAFLLVVIHSTLNALWFGALVVLLGRLRAFGIGRGIGGRGIGRVLKGVTGVVFIGFGIKLATLKN